MKAVIQAGGKGTRLKPYTMVLPKPLMPVGNRPVIELLLKWLRRNGTRDVYVTTGYLGHLIRSLCGDGREWDLRIKYTSEAEPMGTMGALNLVSDDLDGTFLVINGDIITDLNISAFSAFHRRHGALLSVATAKKTIAIDFGVIDIEAEQATAFREKPSLKWNVSMGVYCMEPEILSLIPTKGPFGFDNLMFSMLGRNLPIATYEHEGQWLDIGRLEDFQKAQELIVTDNMPVLELAVI
jgi:NDP-mannose synthase